MQLCSVQPCSVQLVFHCLVEDWKDCEELKPESKEKGIFVNRKRWTKEASDGVVCDSIYIYICISV